MSDSAKVAAEDIHLSTNTTITEWDKNFKSDIEKANPISQLHFWYVLKTLTVALKHQGQEKGLEDKDLVTFPNFRRADVMEKNFLKDIQAQKKSNPKKKPSLTHAIVNTTKMTIAKCVIVAICFSFVRIFTGWVFKQLIDSLTVSKSDSFKWAGAIAPCLIVGFYLEHHYNHIGTYFPLHIRGALVSLIYNKVSKLSLASIIKISPGQIINLASNDVNVFDETGLYFPKLVMSPLVLVACSALLWIYFGPICLIGIGYIVFWYPIEAFFIARSEKHSEEKNKVSDDRVRLTRESIEGIRLLKMYSWELRFKNRIFETRKQEVGHLKTGLLEQCNWRAISFSSLAVSTFLIYMPYTLTGGELTAGKVFSSFYIMAFMRLYCAFFVNLGLVFLIQARMVIKRIEKIMEVPEIGEITFEAPKDTTNAVEFENYNANWTKRETQDEGSVKINMYMPHKAIKEQPIIPTLKDINVNIKKNSLNALVGAVGSGKTSFLMAFTGEIPETTGALRYKGKVAYVEQEPTIFAGTFRDSICFGKPFEPEYYEKVIKGCNLETDLKLFPNGDLSEIGEKGNNLSGGQKARLALARAVYAEADIYLLDDPLSAVDPKVAKSIYENCIRELLKDKTVILVTHAVDYAKSCENIIVMNDGHVLGSGSFDQLKEQNIDTNKIFASINSQEDEPEPVKEEKDVKIQNSNEVAEVNKPKTEQNNSESKGNGEVQKKKKPNNYAGQLSLRTFKELLRGMGSCFFLLILLAAYVSTEMANIAYGRMLGALLVGQFPRWKCLAILGGLVGYTVFIYFVKYIMLNIGLLRTSDRHHKKMLDKVIQAPVLFFDTNPIGLILNRFSNDIGSLDRFLPLVTMDVLDNVFYIGSVIITVGIIQPILLAPLAAAVSAVVIALKICYEGVKQTKKYDVAAKGPLFGLFSASLSGIVIVRTFNQLENFSHKFKHQLHSSLKGAIGFAQAARFVGFYSDMAYNIAEIGCIFILVARHNINSDPCFTGFAIALILTISGILQYTLRQGCLSNTLIVAAARVQGYWELPNEAPIAQPKDDELKELGWPQKGQISLNKVFMKYSPDGPHVIKNLSVHVEAGQKVGCVGRTGAGKTSITMLLYRLQEVDREADKDGHIAIDNVGTHNMGLHLLRGNISMIPQTPFILTGTVRYNIDPLGQVSDEEIWKVLEDVRLKEHVENLPQQLDTEMTAMTSVFSVGQKQLVCLARSILRPSAIMIMDEATANMDHETDNFVTNKIMEKFSGATIFTIAHRLSTVANYDRILALDKGIVKEFDEPYKLLVKQIGDDRITNDEGLFASMVKNTGPTSSKYIFEITKKAYYDRLAKLSQ